MEDGVKRTIDLWRKKFFGEAPWILAKILSKMANGIFKELS